MKKTSVCVVGTEREYSEEIILYHRFWSFRNDSVVSRHYLLYTRQPRVPCTALLGLCKGAARYRDARFTPGFGSNKVINLPDPVRESGGSRTTRPGLSLFFKGDSNSCSPMSKTLTSPCSRIHFLVWYLTHKSKMLCNQKSVRTGCIHGT
jgi:hypothetical protein